MAVNYHITGQNGMPEWYKYKYKFSFKYVDDFYFKIK